MGYLNENGIARYDGLIKNWVTLKSGTVDGIDPFLNWQKTEIADVVTCYPLPATPIDPTVNFTFTETGPAEGDKAPNNPSTITGVTQVKVTRCGKNFAPVNANASTIGLGITFTQLEDGGYRIVGTPSTNVHYNIISDYSFIIPANATSVVSLKSASYNAKVVFQAWPRSGSAYFNVCAGDSVTIAANGETRYANIRLTVLANAGTLDVVVYPQVEIGNSETVFEKPIFNDYTFSLGDTFYGGSVDLSAGTMTVTWREKTLNGSEPALSSTAGYLLQDTTSVYIDKTNLEFAGFIGANGYTNNIACTMFDTMSQATGSEGVRIAQNGNFSLCLDNARLVAYGYEYGDSVSDAVAAVKAWLADNNVTIFYRTTQPVSVSLTPLQIYSLSQLDLYTPRINTVYSDQASVQVGYPKSPLATSTELANAIISLGGNI